MIAAFPSGSTLNLTYGYDANGNVISVVDAVGPTGVQSLENPETYSYETGTNKLSHIETTPPIDFGYDANANITSETGWTYQYDLSNQLIRVQNGGTTVAEYVYNGIGQRIKKSGQGTTRIFHYNRSGDLISETTQSGQTLVEYIYVGSRLLAQIQGEQVYYYHNDHLGTPQILTDDSGNIAWKAAYTPFGEAEVSIGVVENPHRFRGQYYDAETGLHYNYFRYYNPQTGRYMTPDPIGLEGGINLFGYVHNNPTNLIDPFGLTWGDIDPAISVIKETQKDLKFPKNIDPSYKKALGRYDYFTDTIKLNEKYLRELSDEEAADLLDTLMEETLHANDSFWKQLLDTFRIHPDVVNETDRRVKQILQYYLHERGIDPCK